MPPLSWRALRRGIRRRGPRRTAPVLVALGLALAPGLAGCPKPPRHDGPNLWLSDLCGSAVLRVDVPRAEPWPEGLEVLEVRGGVALISIPIRAAAGVEIEATDARVTRVWSLPWPVAADAHDAARAPRLEGLDLPRFVPGAPPAPSGGPPAARAEGFGFFVNEAARELVIGLPPARPLPESWRMVYPVQAAHLVGGALPEGVDHQDVHAARRIEGEIAYEGVALRAGTALTFELPALPSGRFLARVDAGEVGTASEGAIVHVRVRLNGATIHTGELTVGGEDIEIEVPTQVQRTVGSLELSAEGPSDVIVFFEEPLFSRPRDHTDTSNAMLIVIDTLRADRLTVLGGRKELTPALDRLADRSMVFGTCWSGSSWTLPSMATILTSNYGPQHGATLNTRRLGPGLDTLPEVFRRAGYRTAAFTGGGFVSTAFGLDRGFGTFDGRGGGVAAVLDRARAWMERAGAGPWFLMLHTYEVHAPYLPPEEARKEVMRKYRKTLGQTAPEPHLFYDRVQRNPKQLQPVAAALEALYDEEVRYTDQVLGAFLEELRESGELQHLAIALTSDHGEEFGEHGLLGHGDTLYDEQLHVPFLLHLPRDRRRGEVEWRPTSQIDLAPSLLDAAGQWDLLADTTFYGATLLRGERAIRPYASRDEESAGRLQALRQQNDVLIFGRYVYPRAAEGAELYDLAADRFQRRNRAKSDPQTFQRMKNALQFASQIFEKSEVTVEETAPDAAKRNELDKLGYAGEDD